MAETMRDHVSAVRSMSRLFTADNKITSRTLSNEIRSAALLLIKQQTDKRKLWQSPNLFTTFSCIEMQPARLSECCSYQTDCVISRSRHKLPRIAEGTFGLLISGVFSPDNSLSYNYSTPDRYANLKKLKLPCLPECYWISDDYLYVTSPYTELVKMLAYPEDPVPNHFLACGKIDSKCQNPLDTRFYIPGFLTRQVMDLVYDRLMKTYFSIHQDLTTNNVEQPGK